jgi:hypothetical protein
MKADGISTAFQHSAFEIVIEKHLGYAAPGIEGGDMTAQEIGHLGIEVKLHEDAARVAEDHDEGHQLMLRLADGDLSEKTPLCR